MTKLIYKVTNKINGKTYIGATTKSLEERKQDHLQKAFNNSESPFHKAISTYGLNSFDWETVDTASSNNELAEKEVQYIYNYKENGGVYNENRGGGINKDVYQYEADSLKLKSKYPSLDEAANAIDSTRKALSKTCLSVNQFHRGYFWSYNCTEYFEPNKDKRKKQVYQFTQFGEFVNSFESIAEACKQTNVNKCSIAKVCRGERNHAGGFKWSYK
ncbi:NUMOD1 domain-containing DNA-binding protein [Winogradskyella sp. SYSU M77433]|uniref:NUMOD1 domain-containing DNA-binding protein n=1 Tax=Winogradskyella sp. SYSU M77433 TaxID=3042722 RepID=UPI0024801271|nr:NUMOD1 domain-containing DNA-binding protein [Winogradskyella sp. SYSU M77433]MDH7912080.1 NUMOD1 domain-containing DNA-binding protein [Winogradskyella sp. SYSU M77433]